jgi:tol-pal system protein YbgF
MRIRFDRARFLQTGVLAALLAFAAINPAFAQNSDVSARISRIENEIDTLSRAIFKGETPPPGAFSGGGASADVENRLSQIQMDLQTLTGKLEEQTYELNRLKDIEARVMALESRPQAAGIDTGYSGTGMATATTSGSPSYTYSNTTVPQPDVPVDEGFTVPDPDAPAPANSPTAGHLGSIVTTVDQGGNEIAMPGSPTGDYEAAFTLLRNQDYAAAQVAFDSFIKKNPGNGLVPNAMYWLGETYYVRNQFPEATRVFAEAYQKYPKGAKAPDNLLKLAMALAGQGKTKDACVALGQLKKEYPAGAAPVLTRGDQEIERLNCTSLLAQ